MPWLYFAVADSKNNFQALVSILEVSIGIDLTRTFTKVGLVKASIGVSLVKVFIKIGLVIWNISANRTVDFLKFAIIKIALLEV